MPIYELACKECGKEYERIVSFSSTILPACPTCGSVEVMRLLSKPAIHFKGSGWYITDSKKEDEKKKAAAQKADSNGASAEKSAEESAEKSTESESKSETKSETKGETKTEAKSSSSSGSKGSAKEEG